MKNYPGIFSRTPEPTYMARCRGLTKETVMALFDKYESILDGSKFTTEKINNLDESGLSAVYKAF